MAIPAFENIRVVDDKGFLTPEWQNILQDLFASLQYRLSDEGLVMPSLTRAQIDQLTDSPEGTQIYDTTNHYPVIFMDGKWQVVLESDGGKKNEILYQKDTGIIGYVPVVKDATLITDVNGKPYLYPTIANGIMAGRVAVEATENVDGTVGDPQSVYAPRYIPPLNNGVLIDSPTGEPGYLPPRPNGIFLNSPDGVPEYLPTLSNGNLIVSPTGIPTYLLSRIKLRYEEKEG